MTTVRCKVMIIDHSHKLPLRVFVPTAAGREFRYKALFTVMNELGQVAAYQLCVSREFKEVLPLLQGLRRRHQMQVGRLSLLFSHK